jgi:hypothetical protein
METSSGGEAAKNMAKWWLDMLVQVEEWRTNYATLMSKIKFTVPTFDCEAWLKSDDVKAFIASKNK